MGLLLQINYLVLYTLSVFAALWQRGHAQLTCVVLAAVLPVGLCSRLPPRWLPQWLRQGLRWATAVLGVTWCCARMDAVPPDLAIAECIAILGVALILSEGGPEYEWLALIALILVGVGGTTAGRPAFLLAAAGFLCVGTLLLYQTRTARLVGRLQQTLWTRPQPLCRGNWGYRAMHFVLFLVFCLVGVKMAHVGTGATKGLVPVSYRARHAMEFPLRWRDWLGADANLAPSDSGSKSVDSGTDPSAIADDAKVMVDLKSDRFKAKQGSGGSGIGTDLVMRVRAPGKLYWLVQLYDTYTGSTWRRSRTLTAGDSGLDTAPPARRGTFVQYFDIVKPLSRRLPGAFRAERYKWHRDGRPPTSEPGRDYREEGWDVVVDTVSGARLRGDPPPPPWRYACVSVMATPELPAGEPGPEPVVEAPAAPRGHSDYLMLPEKVISQRVRDLAVTVTQAQQSDLEKALALRDYLRSNYRYTLKPPPVPRRAEVVDFFLFESREGYCQHFAQALTVLARCAGLPARLASGFSPGNYDVLANTFEVYEYHAHAWTQIYTRRDGWLTFDGVAPGELNIESKPGLLANLLDPFGEEWEARPPELVLREEAGLRQDSRQSGAGSRQQSALVEALGHVEMDAWKRAGGRPPGLSHRLKALTAQSGVGLKTLGRKAMDLGRRLYGSVRDTVVALWRGLSAWMAARTLVELAFLIAAVLACAALLALRKAVLAAVGRWRRSRRCALLWRHLTHGVQAAPNRVVGLCNMLIWELLAYASYHRPAGVDMLEYADALERTEPELAGDLRVVFTAFARHVFADRTLTDADAAASLESTARIRERLLLSQARPRPADRRQS